MSIEILQDVFKNLQNHPDNSNWTIHLLHFHHNQKDGTIYNCIKIELHPKECLKQLLLDIATAHLDGTKARLKKYTEVRDYDGTCNGTIIYRITKDNTSISIDLDALLQGIANSDSEVDPEKIKYQAYALCGTIELFGESKEVKLISMNTPITTMKNKFTFLSKRQFEKLSKPVLNLRTSINVVIIDQDVFFLDMSGETLFNMERAYKQKCEKIVSDIENMKLVSNMEVFRKIATSGQNPRKFIAFQDSKLQLLRREPIRKEVSKKFDIPLSDDNACFITDDVNSEKLIKVLCNKAMWDTIENRPVEVDGSKKW